MTKDCTKVSMYTFIMQQFEEKKNMPALGFLNKSFTYARLSEEIDRAACSFVKAGLKKGDVVTMALPNIPSAVSLFYAANKIGLVVNLVHPLSPYSQLKETMDKNNSKMMFSIDVVLDEYVDKAVKDGVKTVCCKAEDWLAFPLKPVVALLGKKPCKNVRANKNNITFIEDFLTDDIFDVPADDSWDETRIIMHSSGTSDKPKSVMLSSRNFNTIAYFTIEVLPQGRSELGNGRAMITVLPMFHGFGLGVTFHTILSYGYQAVLIPKFNPKAIIKKMKSNKNIELIAGVPTMFNAIVNQKGFDGKHLSHMKFAFCGGDKVTRCLKDKFNGAMERNGSACVLDEGYGLTETAGVISVNRLGARCEDSVGKPLGDYRAEAFAPDSAKLMPRGETGEICIGGDVVMNAYVENGGDTFFEFEGQRFVRTGDLGYVDAGGFIFIKSRIKRMVKVSGVNVYPAEAEKLICKLEGVQDCCVVHRSHPHKGSEMVAFIVKDAGADEAKVMADIVEQCAEKLNKWTNPRAFMFLDKIPLTNIGKHDYKLLEKEAEEI